jgi:hypothetical protein
MATAPSPLFSTSASAVSPQRQNGSDCASKLRCAGVAVILTAVVVGILGLLVYLGPLNISWTGVGFSKPNNGFLHHDRQWRRRSYTPLNSSRYFMLQPCEGY